MNCSLHFNHSLWDLDGKRNVFFDAKDSQPENHGVQDKVSDVFKYWMGTQNFKVIVVNITSI